MRKLIDTNYKDIRKTETLDMLLGEFVGEGTTRRVHRVFYNSTLVIKIADSSAGRRANFAEFEVWEALRNTPQAKYLAQAHAISAYGAALVMEYVPDCSPGSYSVPRFLNDIKLSNFGDRKGQIVCRDYALHSLAELGAVTGNKRVKFLRA